MCEAGCTVGGYGRQVFVHLFDFHLKCIEELICVDFSGAGKSTLMSALAHRNPAGTIVKGDILVNNRPVGPFMHRLSGFVHQDDLFNGALTVLEHITFMVRNRVFHHFAQNPVNQCVLVFSFLQG